MPPPNSFPGPGNTGFQRAPGYPGHLTNCNNLVVHSHTTYRYCDFPEGLAVGDASHVLLDVTFIGCRFASNAVDNANVSDYGDGVLFSYDTFEPSTVPASAEPISPAAAPIPNSKGYQYGVLQYGGALTISHSDFWGFANAVQFSSSSQAHPVIVSDTWIHNARDPAGTDHTDGILENNGGLSYMVFHHNSIVGDGNTNALALQGGVPYHHVTITNNYFSGYGYMVNAGSNTRSTDMVFVGNVWGTDFKPGYGPLYGNNMFTTPGLGGVWRDNTIYVAPGTHWMAAANSGRYWWPTDHNPNGPMQVVGHPTDYGGP
jgi:hypothetical protein